MTSIQAVQDLKIEPAPRRIRVFFGGKYVVDTYHAKYVWEHPKYPYYYFSASELSEEYLRLNSSGKEFDTLDLVVGESIAPCAVTRYQPEADHSLAGLLKIEFSAPDFWFEDDEQIFVHPRDPFKRVDVIQSSRHVRIEVAGVEVANTTKPRLLYETTLRTRTYIPLTDCRLEFFETSELTTECPYKGVANYYTIRLPNGVVEKDIVWWYRTPLGAVAEIKGMVAFYDEKVDVWVDGKKQ